MRRRTFIKTASGAAALIGKTSVSELFGQAAGTDALEKILRNPPAEAGLSIVYHWTGGIVTKEGITADIEGMASSGFNTVNWFYFDGSGISDGIQVWPCKSPQWWDLVDHLMSEAKRVGLTVAPHVCSSWGPAGTEGITPELSQQVLCWSEQEAEGSRPFTAALGRPQRPAGRSRGRDGPAFPPFWSNYYRDLAVLAFPIPADWGGNQRNAQGQCNHQPAYRRSGQGCRSGRHPARCQYRQSGLDSVCLRPAVHATVTQTRARYFRLVYNPAQPLGYDEGMRTGTRQGSADLKNMIEPLGFASIVLSSTPAVHLLPAKNNSTWGRGRLVTDDEIPASACVPLDSIVDLTNKLKDDGTIDDWTPPAGKWKVMRFGYTTQMTTTGGGLQCDKFSADAARVVFNGWFGQFLKRNADARQMIKTMNVDDMEYFKYTDWTGGEFWVRATQNWKPNDIADAVSAARMYGKRIVFSKAWTGGRWENHPFALKAMGDHNFAEGLNRMMLHVWNQQYYPKRVPGQPVTINADAPDGTNPVLVGEERKGWGMEFCHRQAQGLDIYFLSNQEYFPVSTEVSFPVRNSTKQVQLKAGSWTESNDEDVKFVSGTATCIKEFRISAAQKAAGKRLHLDLGDVQNLARVRLNDKELGVLWKAPCTVNITAAAAVGANTLELEITNTWFNRIAGDEGKPQEQRVTWAGSAGRGRGGGPGQSTLAPGAPPQLLPAGLIGPVRLVSEVKVTTI